jgi:phosphoenolpyruvate-protein kinase (PTS system EI component)
MSENVLTFPTAVIASTGAAPRSAELTLALAKLLNKERSDDVADALSRLLAGICCVNATAEEAIDTAKLIAADIEALILTMRPPA